MLNHPTFNDDWEWMVQVKKYVVNLFRGGTLPSPAIPLSTNRLEQSGGSTPQFRWISVGKAGYEPDGDQVDDSFYYI